MWGPVTELALRSPNRLIFLVLRAALAVFERSSEIIAEYFSIVIIPNMNTVSRYTYAYSFTQHKYDIKRLFFFIHCLVWANGSSHLHTFSIDFASNLASLTFATPNRFWAKRNRRWCKKTVISCSMKKYWCEFATAIDFAFGPARRLVCYYVARVDEYANRQRLMTPQTDSVDRSADSAPQEWWNLFILILIFGRASVRFAHPTWMHLSSIGWSA